MISVSIILQEARRKLNGLITMHLKKKEAKKQKKNPKLVRVGQTQQTFKSLLKINGDVF